MTFLFNVILPILLVAGAAALAQRWLQIDVRPLSRAAFYLFGPALVFDSLARSTVDGSEFLQISAVTLLGTAALWVLGEVLARGLRLAGPTRSAFLLTLLLINSGNYGLPAVQFAFGDAGLARATIFFTISATTSASLGVYLAARGRASALLALRRLAGVPMIYAAALGLAGNLAGLTPPEPVSKAIGLLGQGAVPAFLVVLGLQLAGTFGARRQRLHLPAVAVAAGGRLIVAPVLALALAVALGLPALTRNVVLLESAMPSAVVSTILATEFDADPGLVTVVVFITTLVSVLTLTLWLNLMTIL